MATHTRPYRNGALYGVEYLFDEPGDGVRMHRHHQRPDEEHNIIVLEGEVLVYGPHGSRPRLGNAGTIIDIDSRLFHEVRGMKRNTRTIHLNLSGEPASSRALSDEAKTGQYNAVLTHTYKDGVLTMLPEWSEVLKEST